MYLLRLDDAAEYMNRSNWDRMEDLLDKYSIKPIVGVIPSVQDPELTAYDYIENFWEKASVWEEKSWSIALHGYSHVTETDQGGINPVNKRSEFAGLDLQLQKEKIRNGYKILKDHNVPPKIFFAPSHTFDLNTLIALKEETPIRIISDTIANAVYFENDFYFIPQQSGKVRKLPFILSTFCYHPNKMTDDDFSYLESFLKIYQNEFTNFQSVKLSKRQKSIFDKVLQKIYFIRKK